ncbi:MAG TPA: transglycosylase domain-containing protein [Microbacteriaceae bacterium]|nr:transglycosylase domain-containing protein [Microbacteriaceae bacterium]
MHTPAPMKKRNPIGAFGGLIGAIVMSVIAGILLTAAVAPVVALTGTAASSAVTLFENLPSHIDPGKQAQPSTIYAVTDDGKRSKITSFYTQDRVEVGWNQIAQSVKDAAIAVEDPAFYSHGGVNVLSAARAAAQNAVTGEGPGASTISMQYVRNVLVQEAEALLDEDERNEAWEEAMGREVDRKIKEMRLAISLEKEYTKNEILLGYLNIALFGRKIYGIESAANYYYNKKATELNIAEAASLIAIVNSPAEFQIDIEENIPANKVRRDYILDKMLQHGKITEEEHEEAIASEIVPEITPKNSGCTEVKNMGLGHFCNYVKLYIENDANFGNSPEERLHALSRGGFQIDTTIDLDIQTSAYNGIIENVQPQYPGFDAGGAAVTVEAGTGRVLAMVQNRQFSENPVALEENPDLTSVNFNTDKEYGGSSGFQIASTVKAFTLAAWLKAGRSLNERVNSDGRTFDYSKIPAHCFDGGIVGYGTFKVQNHLDIQWGTKTVNEAMALSSNAAFATMLEKTDLCDIIDLAEDMGLHRASDQMDPDLSNYGTRDITRVPATVYAGTDEVAPITLASSYAGFAAKGKVCEPVPIDKITDLDGNDIPFTKSTCRQAIDPEIAAGVTYSLENNVNNGIGQHAASVHGVPHFAKTGTSDDFWDHWTVGGSTVAVTAVWTGNIVGKVNTEWSGLPYDGDRLMGIIVNAVDAKFGGEPFDRPGASALRVVTKTVPDTTGKTPEEAKQMLETLGFSVRDGGETSSSEAKGRVARTEPGGGTSAPEGSDITIYRSDGSLIQVPGGLQGSSVQSAVSALHSAGFTQVKAVCSSGSGSPKDSDSVDSVSPSSGSDAKRNGQIVVSASCKTEDPPSDDKKDKDKDSEDSDD